MSINCHHDHHHHLLYHVGAVHSSDIVIMYTLPPTIMLLLPPYHLLHHYHHHHPNTSMPLPPCLSQQICQPTSPKSNPTSPQLSLHFLHQQLNHYQHHHHLLLCLHQHLSKISINTPVLSHLFLSNHFNLPHHLY